MKILNYQIFFEKKNPAPLFGTGLPFFSDSGAIRTHDPQLRRLLLYPAELPNLRIFLTLQRYMLFLYLPNFFEVFFKKNYKSLIFKKILTEINKVNFLCCTG